jgi:uncharacterized protein YaaN involved in tellurite resistance
MLPATVRASLTEEARITLERIDERSVKDEILSVGSKIQDAGIRTSQLLKVTFKDIIEENPMRTELEDNMNNMRDAANKLDPEKLGKLGIIARIFTRNPLAAQLRKMARGYESAESHITTLEKALNDGAEFLKKDSSELLNIYNNISQQQVKVAEHSFVLEQLITGLQEKKKDTTYVIDRAFEHQMIANLQDSKLNMLANQQFMLSIDMTVNNNYSLAQSVKRTAGTVGTIARTGMAIQAALVRQKRVVELVEATKKDMSDRLVANARMVESNTADIAAAASNPILCLDKVKESYKILQQAVRDLEVIHDKTSKEALTSLDSINRVTQELKGMANIGSSLKEIPAPTAPPSPQVRADA